MSSLDGAALAAVGVGKRYGARVALADVSLAIQPGEVVGLLGPNGAGKTTTLSILATVLRPDTGHVLIDGRRPEGVHRTLRRRLGIVPQSLALYPTLTVRENVLHFARMQGSSRREARDACAQALEAVDLAPRAGDRMQTLSGGMQRRLNLACGLVHRPAVLLLDEPTVGVDLESRERILRLVRAMRDAGTAVIYSTHYMEEAERLCDRVLLIDRGRLVADGAVEDLIRRAGARTTMRLTYRGRLPERWPGALDGIRRDPGHDVDGCATFELAHHRQIGDVLDQIRTAGARVLDFSLRSANLADAFVALTGRTLGDHPRA